jgi:hypothetical protein
MVTFSHFNRGSSLDRCNGLRQTNSNSSEWLEHRQAARTDAESLTRIFAHNRADASEMGKLLIAAVLSLASWFGPSSQPQPTKKGERLSVWSRSRQRGPK